MSSRPLPPPPEILLFQGDEDLKEQARTIDREYFSNFPNLTKKFYVFFESAEQACVEIYSSKYKSPEKALKGYTWTIRTLREVFPQTAYLLLVALLICQIASIFIFLGKYPFIASLALVLASLLTFPGVSDAFINIGDIFFFYWTIPALVGGLFFLIPSVIGWYFDPKRKDIRISPIRDIVIGIVLAAVGVIVTVGLGSEGIIAGAPVLLILYGVYRILRAVYRLFKSLRLKK